MIRIKSNVNLDSDRIIIYIAAGYVTLSAQFIFTYALIRFALYVKGKSNMKRVRYALLVLLCVGALTPIFEIGRTMSNTANKNDVELINNTIYDLGNPDTDNEKIIVKVKEQVYIYGYENSFFFKVFGKSL